MPLSAVSAVADAGPLIALARLDLLWLLPRIFRVVHAPEAVLAECLAQPALPDSVRIKSACDIGQLIVCTATPITASHLGAGERSAIGRAAQTGATLLLDDLAARRHAQALRLGVIGTLGVLVHAKRMELPPSIAGLVAELRAGGYWFSDATVMAVLRAAGEHGK